MPEIHLGISTCPNDTFVFHALLEDLVDTRGLSFRIELLDVQALNEGLAAGAFDVAKASFAAALRIGHELVVLPTGSALGFGVGPVLLAARAGTHPRDTDAGRPARVLCPGEDTTATLLYRCFHGHEGEIRQVVFSEIMPALESGAADFGVCIHEGRFTYRQRGLHLVEDLGARWEQATDLPLPLGGIVGRKRLGEEVLAAVNAVIGDSLGFALAHRAETLPTLRRHAQELDDAVLLAHVDTYVNDWTRDLGDQGRQALTTLDQLARENSLVRASAPPLAVLAPGA